MFFNHTLLVSLFGSWSKDIVQLFTEMPSSGPFEDYNGPTLHIGEREYVVVGFWKIGSGLGLAASMLVLALIAVLHEAVLGLRFFLEREQTLLSPQAEIRQSAESQNAAGGATYMNDPDPDQPHQQTRRQRAREEAREIVRRVFSRKRMLQALLYLIQWSLFLFCFVLVPCSTFNFALIMAALVGKTAGYLLFIGSPAMESVERLPPSSSGHAATMQLAATCKNLRSF